MDWPPRPGQLVCCVDDKPTNSYGIIEIVRGQIYTVRQVTDPDELIAFYLGIDLEPGLLLKEVKRVPEPDLGEIPFRLSRFRPIDPDGIEIFRRMLAPTDLVPA